MVPGVGGDDGVVTQELVEGVGDDLRLHWHVCAGAAFLHQLAPVRHALLRLLEELVVLLLEQREQRGEDALCVADQGRVYGMAEPDTGGVQIDLNAPGLAGFGQELHVGEAGADDDEGVAVFHGIDGGRGAEEPETAGSVGAAVGERGLAEERFDDGATYGFSELGELFGLLRARRVRRGWRRGSRR